MSRQGEDEAAEAEDTAEAGEAPDAGAPPAGPRRGGPWTGDAVVEGEELPVVPATAERPRLQRLAATLGIGGVLVLGVMAAAVGVSHERSRAAQRDEEAAVEAATAIEDELLRSMGALGAANSLAVDGEVTTEEFEAYADDVIEGTGFSTLALEAVVDGEDRAAFERAQGLEILGLDADGELVPADERDRYLPVIGIAPRGSEETAVLGFDITSEPVRAETAARAEQQRQPVLSDPVELTTDGASAFLVVQPLYARSGDGPGDLVAFVSSALRGSDLVAEAGERLPAGATVGLRAGDTVLAGDTSGGAEATIRAGDRPWVVTADHPTGTSATLPLVLATATLAVAALLGFSARRDRRYQEANAALTARLAVDAARDAVLATVARRLSFASGTDAVTDIITADVASVVGADHADLGLLLDADHVSMSHRRSPLDPEVLGRYQRVAVDAHLPSTEAVRERRMIVVEDLAGYQADDPDVLADVRATGVVSVVAAPLYGSDGEAVGVLVFLWSSPATLDDGTLDTVETLARLCGQTLRRTRLADSTAQLAQLAAAMAVTTSPEDVARLVDEHVSTALGAAHAAVRVVDRATGTLDPVVPDDLPTGPEGDDERIPLDAAHPLADAVRSDAAVWLADPDELRERYPAAADDVDRAGFAASASLPLHGSRGTPTGAIAFAWRNAMRFDPGLREALATVADVTAQTLERTRLAAAHQRRAEGLGRLAQVLATSVTPDGVAEAVARHVPGLLDASHAVVAVADGDGRSIEPMAVAGVAASDAGRTAAGDATSSGVTAGLAPRRGRRGAVPAERRAPVADALRANETLLFPDATARRAAYPDLADDPAHEGIEASAHLPLRDAEGTANGVLSVGWSAPMSFDPAAHVLLDTVADLVGQTLERATLHANEHAVVATLQRRLLTTPPDVPGLDVAVHYEPASGAVGIGGDWYDAVALDDGGLVVVVGDVTGHGVQAVAAMAQLQYLIAGLVRTGTPLDRVFARANDMIAEEDGIYATAQVLHVDHRWHRLGHLSAGHPPALLRLPDGTVRTLSDARQPLLGMPLEPRRLEYVELPAGSLVLAYTDGLVERRARTLSASIAELARQLAATDPDTGTEALLEGLVSSARRPDRTTTALDDDVAAVLIRALA